MKKLSFLLVFVTFLSLHGFAQFQEEDDPMFGNSRKQRISLDTYNFGSITNDIMEYEFTINNTENSTVYINKICYPKGVTALLTADSIVSKKSAKVVVAVHKKYLDKGEFVKYVDIETKEIKPNGMVIRRTNTYEIKGKLE